MVSQIHWIENPYSTKNWSLYIKKTPAQFRARMITIQTILQAFLKRSFTRISWTIIKVDWCVVDDVVPREYAIAKWYWVLLQCLAYPTMKIEAPVTSRWSLRANAICWIASSETGPSLCANGSRMYFFSLLAPLTRCSSSSLMPSRGKASTKKEVMRTKKNVSHADIKNANMTCDYETVRI